jgi:hypothetical protein|tara:strand:+ start:45 stop:296 length:252 start_codon:yes stop_codon:yes gene_type:complete
MGNTSTTYRGPNGGKQKLSIEARKKKQATDKKNAMIRTSEKATAQVFRRNLKNVDLAGKDVHHSSDGSMSLQSIKNNRGHHVT